MKKKKKLIIGLAILVVLIAVVIGVFLYAKSFLSAETAIRDDWSIETGDLLTSDASLDVSVFEADVEASIPVSRVLPDENEEEGFTYYDEDVQRRLAAAIVKMAKEEDFTMEAPLAILNPFGTGSNGLYLHFDTRKAGNIRYTIHVENADIPDYTQTAYEGGGTRTRHEFQMIGLVAGEENTVTMELLGKRGKVISTSTFTIHMPETMSGYDIILDSEDGESQAELSDGLYAMIRVGGHTGYAFFYDNDGVMRYEMVLEGYGLDRILWYEGNMTVCASAYKIAQVNRLGQAVAAYDTGDWELHHDMVLEGDEGRIVALASDATDELNLEDMTIEVDLETGEVKEILDFKDIFSDYYENDASELTATDEFFWLAGQKDWIHLNTIQYLPKDDSVIVSSRETSTIIKIKDIHTDPQIDYLIGDEDYWKGTPYEEYSYAQVGDFTPQYGQHTVEYYEGEGLKEDQYYLMMFDNNYWVNGTRDDYEIEDLPEEVGTVLASDSLKSHVYVYLVDEGEKTFSLVHAFDVPYSSIVSNVTPCGDNLVVNSGTANVFGEYDVNGGLIRQFSYTCELQTYRVMKDDFAGFWFIAQ